MEDTVSKIEKLTDEQLNTAIVSTDEKVVKQIVEPENTNTETTATNTTDKKKEGEQSESVKDKVVVTPPSQSPLEVEKKDGAGSKDGEGNEKLLAGRFKTKEDLVEGFKNAGKLLNYNEKIVDQLIASAGDDVKKIEELYKELDLAISQNKKILDAERLKASSANAERDNPNKRGRDKLDLPNRMNDQVTVEANRVIKENVLTDLHSSRLASRLEKANLPIPKEFGLNKEVTNKYMDLLESEASWFVTDIENFIVQKVRENSEVVSSVLKSMKEAEEKNPTVRKGEVEKIKEEAKKIDLKIEDAEVEAFVDGQMKENPGVYEERDGVQILRPGAIADAWFLKNREKIYEQLRINHELNGRKQAVEDIKKNGETVPSTISHSSIPTDQKSRTQKAEKKDLTDPTVLANLTDNQIDELLADEEKRKALMPT